MKKLLLLPLLVMSMLVGCNENGSNDKEEEKIPEVRDDYDIPNTFENFWD